MTHPPPTRPAPCHSTSLLVAGARTMGQLDMVLPCIALGLILLASIGFARDQVRSYCHVTLM